MKRQILLDLRDEVRLKAVDAIPNGQAVTAQEIVAQHQNVGKLQAYREVLQLIEDKLAIPDENGKKKGRNPALDKFIQDATEHGVALATEMQEE